ncbi:2-(3-amino-3-carboxypropyl)histidine synthase subunit 2 [Camellia lanceoleosa]|uniref:2-(3-amino-3-carboxypropyl)histidine synthase subunit 2 n=1 Tax=Camellia lanceoleosa TaxID=1840588 RepID=A0ACC0GNY6_9ERIC|nr:2-(3-amino-3-carboxypropyl)histidine synthase subunit 2 [Camellia lanceoleosa]
MLSMDVSVSSPLTRYYLVEKAKNANIVGILVGTLGVGDVFAYVSCAQTALLDSKEFLSPIIAPLEAMIAFSRESQWTGAYVMEFQNLMTSFPMESRDQLEEARFSFLQGGYVEGFELEEIREENEDGTLALVKATEKALQVSGKDPKSIIKGTAKSRAEYLPSQSYHGLDIQSHSSLPKPF